MVNAGIIVTILQEAAKTPHRSKRKPKKKPIL